MQFFAVPSLLGGCIKATDSRRKYMLSDLRNITKISVGMWENWERGYLQADFESLIYIFYKIIT